MCGYGTRLQVAHVLDYLGGNLDTFTVARIASTAVLGQYSRAYYLVFQPLGNYLSAALTNVAFAALSRVQEDPARLRRGYLSMTSLGALLIFPLCAGMAVAAPELVAAVLGPQWGPAVGLVPWFALAGGCHVASQLSQSLAEARAELNRSVAVQVGYLLVLAAFILLALPFSSRGVWVIAAAVAAAELLRYLGYLVLARRVLELPAARVWQAHVPAVFASAGVALAIAAVRWALTGAPVRCPAGGRDHGRSARAGAVHPGVSHAGHPCRASVPAGVGRPARSAPMVDDGAWRRWSWAARTG